MQFVAARDRHPEVRGILCLFEGGACGAADGCARMSGKVALDPEDFVPMDLPTGTLTIARVGEAAPMPDNAIRGR